MSYTRTSVASETRGLIPDSVQHLYAKHGAALAAYACSLGVDFASAEDTVQQIFLKLLRGDVKVTDAPAPYLYRAVRNASFNLMRDRRHEVSLVNEELWLSHVTAEPSEVLMLQGALRELPQEQREIVFLKIWGGLTFQEIANAIDVPRNTVASRYRYALEKLREQLIAKPPARI